MASQEKSMPFIKNLASSGLYFPFSPPKQPPLLLLANQFPTKSSDRKTRTAALASLRTFLSSPQVSTRLTTLDVLKLWKGLFYALWMCDRPLPQQQLCDELSAPLLAVLPPDVVGRWLRGFWATMAREWTTGIDVLRMEKFLLLVRRVLGASLSWMRAREQEAPPPARKTRGSRKRTAEGEEKKTTTDAAAAPPRWDKERADVVLALLSDWPFRPDEETRRGVEGDDDDDDVDDADAELMPKFVPAGLKLHALDIWVDEAERAGLLLQAEDGDRDENESEEEDEGILSGRQVVERINELVERLRAETRSTAVRIRSKESLADERLPWNKPEEEEEGEDGEWGGLDD